MKNREEKTKEKIEFLVRVTDGVMWWIGSIPSLIAHSLIFLSAFLLPLFGWVEFDKMLLVLTTVLSLEAIYLAIFIQMSVNRSQEHIEDLKEDVNEIQEDIEDIAEDEDDEDHNERARKVMLKSNVSSNKSDIKAMREVIANLQKRLEDLKSEEEKTNLPSEK